MQLLIVTGLSGAGKTTALKALEDMGFYCVDNLPPVLIPEMAQLCSETKAIQRVALGVDTRGGVFFAEADKTLKALSKRGISYEVLFFDASDEELVRRYKETRRAHPLGDDGLLIEIIKKERQVLETMRQNASRVIDTTNMLTRQAREMLLRLYGEESLEKALHVSVVSFGFKRGIPQEADLVLDVRFIPNPFYDQALRPLNGLDKPVRDFVLSFDESLVFLDKVVDMLSYLIPRYVSEGKVRLVVGIGCTGGQHRSVALAQALNDALAKKGFKTAVTHRDLPTA